jgi:hypothetical protein
VFVFFHRWSEEGSLIRPPHDAPEWAVDEDYDNPKDLAHGVSGDHDDVGIGDSVDLQEEV